MSSQKSGHAIVVAHTHWDRAWYLPFEEFRYRLVPMIDRIISLLEENDAFTCFVLDGQTILIEDYLEIRKENEDRLKALIQTDRIIIGPWYVLPDLFLVSGESIIRNLQIGHNMTTEFGGKMDIGYVPDPFGHIAQLPQILNGFNISSFIFMRGMPEEVISQNTLIFNWVAPDKSSVLAYYTKDGYLNAANLGYDKEIGRYDFEKPDFNKAKLRIDKSLNSLRNFHPMNSFLLNNGMDHMPEQPELPSLINELNKKNPDVDFQQGSFKDFFDHAEKLETNVYYSGNLLGNPDHPILQSVYSSRTYLKKQNHSAQAMLEKVSEPLSLISAFLTNTEVPSHFFQHAWKTLLKNHPHDDICGCSTDQVHTENEVRFNQVMEIGKSICTDSIEQMMSFGFQSDNSQEFLKDKRSLNLFVFNPHAFDQINWVEADIVFPNLEGEEDEVLRACQLKAFDANGNNVPIEILDTEAPFLKAEFIHFTWGRRYRVKLKVNSPPLGYHVITIAEQEEELTPLKVDVSNGSISNKRYNISWDKKMISVTDFALEKTFEDFIKFEFVQDNGDSYSFSRASSAIFSKLISVEIGDHAESVEAIFSLTVPENLTNSEMIDFRIKVHLDLSNEEDIRFKVEYKNEIENGRLRILLPIGFQSNESYSDGHFMMYKNIVQTELNPEDLKDRYNSYPGELDYPTHFMGNYTFSFGEEFNSWVAAKGLHEYELVEKDEESFFAVTLHRSIGFLSVGNGSIRRPHAGPKIAVPEAQCLRFHRAELSWGLTKSDEFEIHKMANRFAYPLYVREFPVIKGSSPQGALPKMSSFLKLTDNRLALSCLKQADNSSDIILRIYNLSSEKITSEIFIGINSSEYCITDFYEQWNPIQKKNISNNSLNIEIGPHQIMTYRLKK